MLSNVFQFLLALVQLVSPFLKIHKFLEFQVGVVVKLCFKPCVFTASSFKISFSQSSVQDLMFSPSVSYWVILSEGIVFVFVRIRRAYSRAPFEHALKVPEVYIRHFVNVKDLQLQTCLTHVQLEHCVPYAQCSVRSISCSASSEGISFSEPLGAPRHFDPPLTPPSPFGITDQRTPCSASAQAFPLPRWPGS